MFPRRYSRSYLGRAWALVAFAASAGSVALGAEAPDVVIASSPPLTVAIPGWLAARRHDAPLVFEVRDLWPESAITTGVVSAGGLLARMLAWLERKACEASALIAVLTPAFADDLTARGLARPQKIVVVPNGADSSFAPGARDGAIRRQFDWGDRIVALYAGAHGRANALGQLLDAAACLRHRRDVLLVLAGDGPERAGLVRAAADRGLDNVAFLGPRPKSEMPNLIRAADIGLAALQRNPTFKTVYPNKVFDYMASARPVVVAIDGAARRLVCDEAEAGIFAEPEDGQAIADAIVRLADDPNARARLGDNGSRWVRAHATREAMASRYLDQLDALVRAKAPRTVLSPNQASLSRFSEGRGPETVDRGP